MRENIYTHSLPYLGFFPSSSQGRPFFPQAICLPLSFHSLVFSFPQHKMCNIIRLALGLLASVTAASAASMSSVCTSDYVTSALPTSNQDIPTGITINSSSLAVSSWSNYTVTDATFWIDAVVEFCQVKFSYSHQNLGDEVFVTYYMPAPETFQNRFLATGGAAYTINVSCKSSMTCSRKIN